MGVHHHPLVAGQNCGLAHQVTRHGKGRTGRNADPAHGPLARVVKRVDHAHHIGQNRRFIFHQRIGRQTAVALTDAHRAARRMKAQTDLRRRRDCVVQPRTVGEQIQMVRACCATGQGQFGKPRLRRHEHFLRSEPRPDRIERAKPTEQKRVLPARHGPRQTLVEVMMRVHQSRRHDAPARVDHGFASLRRKIAHRIDAPVAQTDRRTGKFAVVIIHRQDGICIGNE